MTAPPDPSTAPRAEPFRALRKNWQAMFKGMRAGGHRIAQTLPPAVRDALATPVSYADMLIVDHGVFRLAYLNQHAISAQAFRSAQPAPHDIRRFARQGIRTILNLRGARDCGGYRLETKACAETGLALVNFTLGSRAAPAKAQIHAAAALFDQIAYPVLMHCKSGADRAGLMAVLYLHLKERVPMADALKQLSLRYGHVRSAHTGILDAFFEQYIAFNAKTPTPFLQWVDEQYDPVALKRNFKATGWGKLLVDGVLRRE